MSATTSITTPSAPPVSRAETINTWGRVVVSAVVVFAFLLALGLVLFHAVQETQTTGYMVNTLGTLATAVVMYWVGSSAGSTAKDARIGTMTPAPAPGTTTTTTTGTTP